MSLLGTAGWTVCFCGRICTACVDLLNRVFSTYLIGFRLRATKQERKSTLKSLRYYVFQDDQGSVFCKWAEKRCSRWRHSSTLGWCPRVTEIGTKIIIHGLVKQTQFYVSFITPWFRNGTFQRPQSFQFSNRSLFRSSPVVKDLKWRLKEYCQKNKRQRWDICEKFSVWRFVTKSTRLKSVKPGMSSHFSESRDPSYVSLAMCPECPGKDWQIDHPHTQKDRNEWTNHRGIFLLRKNVCQDAAKIVESKLDDTQCGPSSGWRDYLSNLAWSRFGVEPTELSEIAVDREVFGSS